MADLPISLLPTAEGLDPADLIPIVNNGVTKKVSVRTIGGTPVDLGAAPAASSIPVVVAVDQNPIPVKQVNQEITQVSLSLLGIPRSETALGIFGDVNTYDVNPLEWTGYPAITGDRADTFGVKHLSAESAAQVSCPPGFIDPDRDLLNFSRLTSKRFFRYQPGRVSSATFGIRHSAYDSNLNLNVDLNQDYVVQDIDLGNTRNAFNIYNKNTTVKKWGIFDNENGYYFEARGTSTGDNFLVVRRTNSIPTQANSSDIFPNSIGGASTTAANQYAGEVGKHGIVVRDKLVLFHAAYFDTTLRATSADIVAGDFVTIQNYQQEPPIQNATPPQYIVNFYTAHRANFDWSAFLRNLTSNFPPRTDGSSFGRLNVKTKYANVYEFRIPRSNFNYDRMDGLSLEENIAAQTPYRWSDTLGSYKTGDKVVDGASGGFVYPSSVKNLDLTKVTMYKIEFSWYGAVGAQFLAYVPVANNLARWVRIHHLRVSNQLTSPSLGNPTLPFTYLNIAGANPSRENLLVQRTYKYGASYLIDGGDKGTVKINSAVNDVDKTIYPDFKVVTVSTLSANFTTGGSTVRNVLSSVNNVFNSYFIGSKIYGNGVNPNSTIQHVSPAGDIAYLGGNKPLGGATTTTASLTCYTNRGTPLLGIKVKDYVNGIRNRLQVYPVRLSVGADSRVVLQLLKNPVFPSLSGNVTDGYYNSNIQFYPDVTDPLGGGGGFAIDAAPIEKEFTSTKQIFGDYNNASNIGKTLVGSFQGIRGELKLVRVGINALQQQTGVYTFRRFNPGEATVVSASVSDRILSGYNCFIPELPLRGDGVVLGATPLTATWVSENYLAGVYEDVYESRTPVAQTGEALATFNVGSGGTDIDLSPYFGYDKQYLTYPLIEDGVPDTLFLVAKSPNKNTVSGGGSLTWEEQ